MIGLIAPALVMVQPTPVAELPEELGPPHENMLRAAGEVHRWIVCSLDGEKEDAETRNLERRYGRRMRDVGLAVTKEYGVEAAQRSYISTAHCESARNERDYRHGLGRRTRTFLALLGEWEARYGIRQEIAR